MKTRFLLITLSTLAVMSCKKDACENCAVTASPSNNFVPFTPNAGNVFFYFSDPTGSLSGTNYSFDSPKPNLITVSIANNSSGVLNGVWGSTYVPRNPISSDYNGDAASYVGFHLAPGVYNWRAASSIVDLSPYPHTTQNIVEFFLAPHNAAGTITVQPGDTYIIKKIVF